LKGHDVVIHKLHETLGKMEMALGSIAEAIVWTDREGKIQWCNKSFDLLIGKPHITILGQSLEKILLLERNGLAVSGEDSPFWTLAQKRLFSTSIFEYHTTSGPIYLEVSGNSAQTGASEDIYIFTLRDVTDLTKSQGELKEAKELLEFRVEERTGQLLEISDRYKNILIEAVDAIITINQNGLIESFNPSAERIFGYIAQEVLGKNITYIMPSPHKEMHDKYLDNYIQTGIKKIIGIGREVTGVHRNGKKIPLYLAVSEVKTNGKSIFTGILRDISQQKKAEKALQLSKDGAEAANRAKSSFLANMSHEIRTPMNAVLGFSEILSTLVTDRVQRQYLGSIRTAGKSLLTIINDILDLSKVEAGKLDIHLELFNLRALFNEIKVIFQTEAEKKGLEIILDVDPKTPPNLMLDEIRLRQILINLVGNAIKFTHKGYIKLSARIDNDNKGGIFDLSISVEDTGTGIRQSNQKMIFEAFQQQEVDAKNVTGGTGLGLTITKRLVEMMKGKVTLKSQVNKGSLFTVNFPGIKGSYSLPEIKSIEPEFDMALISFEPAVILVVDDVALNRELIRAMLVTTDIEILEAENGEKALEVIRCQKPDIVLLDLRMPVMDGYQMIRILKSDDMMKQIPVVAITASVDVQEKTKLEFSGFNGVLFKPIPQSDLVYELCRFLDSKELKVKSSDLIKDDKENVAINTTTHLQELLQELEDDFLPAWYHFRGALEMDAIKEFAERLHHLAVTHNAHTLQHYAAELSVAAEHFQIDILKNSLQQLPSLIDSIKNENE